MNFNQLKSSILSKDFSPFYIFCGEESYFIDQLTQLIEQSILSEGEKSFNQIVLYGRDIDFKDIIDNARQYPMMSERRVVVVREAQDLKEFKELESYFKSPSPHAVLALAMKGVKPDKRTNAWKLAAKNGLVFESKKVYENKLPQWIKEYLIDKGLKIEPKAVMLISEFLGTDLSKVSMELDKLAINKEEGSTVVADDIYEQIGINKDYNVFELQKAIGARDSAKAYRIAQYFANNPKANPPYMTIPVLSAFFTRLAIGLHYMNVSDNEFAREVGIAPYFVGDSKAAVRNFTKDQLTQIFSLLSEADLKAKGIGTRSRDDMGLYQELIYGILNA